MKMPKNVEAALRVVLSDLKEAFPHDPLVLSDNVAIMVGVDSINHDAYLWMWLNKDDFDDIVSYVLKSLDESEGDDGAANQ